MEFRNIFKTHKVFSSGLAIFAIVFISTVIAGAQSGAPKQEMLLNGLKVLMWSDPKADSVSVRVRIHSGSAFDPQGKEGVMQMLADNFFPNEAAREFFSEDLGGSLEVKANYDYIEVVGTSKPENFLTLLETISTAVANPQIDKETTTRVRAALLKKLELLEADPAYVADTAVASRLFGTFPYGRPQMGTIGSVEKLDFADLVDATRRFITADNATIAVIGNFDRSLGFRAIRRYFGGWLKSDKKIPSTFKQPDEPSTTLLKIASPKSETAELRFAVRGSSRGGKDFATSMIFAAMVESRLKTRVPSAYAGGVSVSNRAHVLPGMILIRMDAAREIVGSADSNVESTITKILSEPFSRLELDAARRIVKNEQLERGLASIWLDSDTFKFEKPEAHASAVDNVSLGDVNGYAERVRKLPMAAVAVVSPRSTS